MTEQIKTTYKYRIRTSDGRLIIHHANPYEAHLTMPILNWLRLLKKSKLINEDDYRYYYTIAKQCDKPPRYTPPEWEINRTPAVRTGRRPMTDEARFESRIKREDDHIIWMGNHTFSIKADVQKGIQRYSKRIPARLLWDKRKDLKDLTHRETLIRTCDKPDCINPDHQIIVSRGDLLREKHRRRYKL